MTCQKSIRSHQATNGQLRRRLPELSKLPEQLFKRLTGTVATGAIAFTISVAIFVFPANCWAANFAGNQINSPSGNQGVSQPANLVALEPDAKIAIYLRPGVGNNKAGYGVNGDAVMVLEQVSDNQSATWNHIRFDAPPHAEGWVQSSFLLIKETTKGRNQTQLPLQQKAGGDQYLGNQRLQFDWKNSTQFYPQQSPRQNSQQNSRQNSQQAQF